MTDFKLTPLALEAEPILRRLARGLAATDTKTSLAREFDRDQSNFTKSLARIEDAGLIAGLSLTPAGVAAIAAIDRAEGRADGALAADAPTPVAGLPRAPIDSFTPDPDQPRKTFDADALLDLARTIHSARDILEPLVVRPPDASGARRIVAGERRWRAAGLLADFKVAGCILPDALDAALGGGLPYVERALPATAAKLAEEAMADTLFLALVENGAREDLDPLEDGAAVLRLMTLRGWSARQAAHELGRVGQVDGQPGAGARGIKTLQERVKVAREATDDAKAAYRAGGTWKALLESVQDKAPGGALNQERAASIRRGVEGLAGRRRLALIEMAHKAVVDPVGDTGRAVATGSRDADAAGTVTALVMHAGAVFSGDEAKISDVALAWVEEQGLLDRTDPARTLRAARAAILSPGRVERLEQSGRWETPWLNLTHDQDDSRVYNGEFYANATMAAEARRRDEGKGGASSPPRRRDPVEDARETAAPQGVASPAAKPLTIGETLALAELYMACARPKGDDHWHLDNHAPVGKYWLDETVSTLKAADRVTIVHRAGDVPRMALTNAGLLALSDAITGVIDNLVGTDWSTLVDLRRVLGVSAPDRMGFVTPWLNPEPLAPAGLGDDAGATPATDDTIDIEDAIDQADDRTVEDILGVALTQIAAERAATDAADFLSQLLDRTGVTGPFVVGQEAADADPATVFDGRGEPLLTVDTVGELTDAMAAARAILVAACLNAAVGLTVDFAPRAETPAPEAA